MREGSAIRTWVNVLIITVLLSLTVLVVGGRGTFVARPPIPERVVAPSGAVLFTGDDIRGGQAVFLKYGLMDYGSVFGHGAYLGPDFTAEYLHKAGLFARDYYAAGAYGRSYRDLSDDQRSAVDNRVITEFKANRYDPAPGVLALTAAQEFAHRQLVVYYRDLFTLGDPSRAIPLGLMKEESRAGDPWLSPKAQAEQLADYFAWTAWAASANRPGLDYSYTNNWPPDRTVGNHPTWAAVIWSNASVGLLLLMLGLMLVLYRVLQLQSLPSDAKQTPRPTLAGMKLSPSQIKTAKYFVVVAGLLVFQTLVGALTAHYFVERKFFGLEVLSYLPFNIARTWHVQSAIFWIATSWLATGLFIAPLVGREPRYQGILVDVLFWAVVIVAVGSLAGHWLGARGLLGKLWYPFGHQGWEYLELGRVWQILLPVGMLIWLLIVYRALRYRLAQEDSWASLSHLLLYAAISIPAFFAFGLFYNPATNFTVADFWRWFVVHLWVEGMFEFFSVVVIAYFLVTLGLVSQRSATRAVLFTLILVFGSGVAGTGHHYYWTGNPVMWMAIGAMFSALEVVPLTVLVFEALDQYGILRRSGQAFEYRGPLMFLIATSFWNFLGAGVLGFITNLPIINYYEHGTYLTPSHGHGALMGVYGMLGLGLLLFVMRSIVRPKAWPDRLVSLSFWLLNLGLIFMLLFDLLPVGFMQLAVSFDRGAWYARSFEFINSPVVRTFIWLRLPGDALFILGSILLLWVTVRGAFNLRPAAVTAGADLSSAGKPDSG